MEHFALTQEARIEKQYPRLLAHLKQNNPQSAHEAAIVITQYFKNCGLSKEQAVNEINVVYYTHLWRMHRTIYRFDEAISDVLANQALRVEEYERIPCELLRTIPHRCISVEMHPFSIQANDIRTGHPGIKLEFTGEFYLYFEENYRWAKQDALIALFKMRDGELVDFFMPLPENGTIKDSKSELHKYISAAMPDLNVTEDDVRIQMLPALIAVQAALYLQAQNADIQNAPPEPKKKKTKRGSGIKRQQKPSKIIYVGYRVGKLLRASADPDDAKKSETGSAKRPHARRGHWHHYWTGPKDKPQERKLILRWVAPTMIHAEKSNGITKIIKIKD